MTVKLNCWHCGEMFDFKYRAGKIYKTIPAVCSGECFIELCQGHRKVNVPIRGKDFPSELKHADYRSEMEAEFAEWLEGTGVPWEYEPYSFEVNNGRDWYVPDFLIDRRVFIEVKGLWEPGAKKKLFDFHYRNPHPIYLVDKDFLRSLKRWRKQGK